MLKESLDRLWNYRYEGALLNYLQRWMDQLRWQRLAPWRKAVAIGGFALGTFGLGFTLGGLIFGRWRKA